MIAKRIFDLVASATGLLLLSPLFVFLAVLIRLDSPGPVFFRQQRVGLRGKLFEVHKFRTMRADNAGPLLTADADTRITRVGGSLRRYRIDELPQLIDVFLGDMSLVGPRPEVPKYMNQYPETQREKILSVRPGITDWTSIRFRDEAQMLKDAANPEATYVEQIMPIKAKMYVEYVERRSFWGDIRILCATIAALAGRK